MGWLFKFVLWIVNMLPDDTLMDNLQGLEDVTKWMGYLNYFVPVNRLLAIISAWLALILAYRTYRILKKIFNRYIGKYTSLF